MNDERGGIDAGEAWEQEAARRRAGSGDRRPALTAPRGVTASEGRGQVTVDWERVDGAAGYLVRRAATPDGPFEPVEIGEPWVRPVPHPPLTDTTLTPGAPVWYTVAAVAAVDDHGQPASDPIMATAAVDGPATCSVTVSTGSPAGRLDRPWQRMVGSERLSQLDHGTGPGGRDIGTEFAAALRLAHDELGVQAVRAHAILHDDLAVYREVDGAPVHDFAGIDRIYDRVLDIGLRPVVEVSFMPHALARDPAQTVFHYDAIISPPKDWDRWARLVGDLAAHLVDRYGLDEVRTWGFEIWNEANLEVFWSGTAEEYFRLYDVSVRAIKAVDAGLLVGGPATAAVGWIDETLDAVAALDAPIDFISTHTYGNAPLDLRPTLARHGHDRLPLWWTEWGAHATHFNRAHDSPWAGAYLVRGMASAMDRIAALASWTISDHFEELGRGSELLHGGFGLLAVGNLRKPRWWAQWMLAQLGDDRVRVDVAGDGAGDMVNAVATTSPGGRTTVVLWNGTVDVTKWRGDALLDRRVTVRIESLSAARYGVRHRRVDEQHSNVNRDWERVGRGRPWPDEAGWAELDEGNVLAELEPPESVATQGGSIELEFDLPMPAVSLIELDPDPPDP